MIESLLLRNFQAHARLRVDLDPGVTTVVGPNGRGKSSVLRFLRWLCTNSPRANNYQKQGESWVGGSLEVDGRLVKRKKGEGNTYTLDGKVFAAVGSNVPEEISDLLNVDEVNFQGQLDAPYWFLLSPGEVSKALNKIINLDLIDRTLFFLASEVKKAKMTVTVGEERLHKAQDALGSLGWTEEADTHLKSLEALEGRLEGLKGQAAKLEGMLEEVRRLEGEKSRFRDPSEDVAVLDGISDRYWKAREKEVALRGLVESLRELEEEECQASRSASEAEGKIQEALREKCPLCGRGEIES